MNQLLGEYYCKMDPKGRLRLPTGLLEQLPAEERELFVVNRGFEKCLNLYPKKVWDIKSAEVTQLNDFDTKSRLFKRNFFRGATPVRKDNSDRLNFPNPLLEYAAITADVVVAAVVDRIEIWSEEEWQKQLSITPQEFSELAQDVMGNSNGSGNASSDI